MTLDEGRVQEFLATREVAVLATVRADGAPLAMPMWFLHDAAALTMISVADTQKVRNLRRDARVCVVAETGGGDDVVHSSVQASHGSLPASFPFRSDRTMFHTRKSTPAA